jgi:hypothetical protein
MYIVIDTELVNNKSWVKSYFFRINKLTKEDKQYDNRKVLKVSDVYSVFYKDPNNWYFDNNGMFRYNSN